MDETKAFVAGLLGQPLKIAVNKGRKRIVRYSGRVLAVYPQVFTLKIVGSKTTELLSCSYADLICGEIKLALA